MTQSPSHSSTVLSLIPTSESTKTEPVFFNTQDYTLDSTNIFHSSCNNVLNLILVRSNKHNNFIITNYPPGERQATAINVISLLLFLWNLTHLWLEGRTTYSLINTRENFILIYCCCGEIGVFFRWDYFNSLEYSINLFI